MNRRLIVGITVLAAIVVFGVGAWYYEGIKAREAESVTPEATWLVRAHSPVLGRADAPVKIVEFFDPSCEACRAFYSLVKSALEAYPDDVRLVIRYTPFHQGSDEAVRILEAARKQGKFEAVLTALMAKQPEWAMHGQPNLERAWAIAREEGWTWRELVVTAQHPRSMRCSRSMSPTSRPTMSGKLLRSS
ncbi:MAG TPA: thioredoxin domain-containing protein [Pseudorhizobium sp.]|jgi:protein-disulfide isomerase|nr:thioredoxin domain-containing protein [Pseudorhizobium sp.]